MTTEQIKNIHALKTEKADLIRTLNHFKKHPEIFATRTVKKDSFDVYNASLTKTEENLEELKKTHGDVRFAEIGSNVELLNTHKRGQVTNIYGALMDNTWNVIAVVLTDNKEIIECSPDEYTVIDKEFPSIDDAKWCYRNEELYK